MNAMAQRRKKAAYRKRHQNKFSMFLVSLTVLMVLAGVSIKKVQLQKKQEALLLEEAQLDEKIAGEEKRAQEIEEYDKYTQTKKYVEEIAKERLGLMYEGEILFKGK